MSNASLLSQLLAPGADGGLVSQDGAVSAGTKTYTTPDDLPLSGNSAGDTAFVESTDRLYIFTGTGWYEIALINTAPQITGGGAGSYELATDGTATVVTLTANDPEGLPITWSYAVTSGSLGNTATVSQADNVFTVTPSTNTADAGEFTITFTASDGVNIATDVNSFSLAFVSALWDETVLSIGTSSTNGLANSSFIDRSTNAHTVTTGGSPVQTTFHPYLDNWSYYTALASEINIAHQPGQAIGSNDFTMEFWVYPTTTAGSNRALVEKGWSGTEYGELLIYTSTGPNYYFYSGDGSTWTVASEFNTGWAQWTGQWKHCAVVRNGTQWSFFLDGVLTGAFTSSADPENSGDPIVLGGESTHTGSRSHNNAYFSNFRWVIGTAVYDATGASVGDQVFTPPTEPLTAITNTQVLTCQSNRFIDESGNTTVIPVNSSSTYTQVETFNPFGPSSFESEYAVGENKGSLLFDGSNDYLTINNDLGGFSNSGWTFEAWLYLNDLSNNSYLISQHSII